MMVFLLVAAVTLAAPALAETTPLAPSSPTAPVSKAKTDFTKPFIYDGLRRQSPPKPPPDRPHVELNAGTGPINR
jgi:hypothetical protein